ncbi:unnamed protein product [Durusdinium trenchii]|uniref:Uncharacterized protein n=1 Tax=Durusdinium trenchii TaxID=1381693 RepID=A0ABP0JIJ6_9DINO
MLVQSRLSRGRARDVWRLYAEPLASAERILRQRRLEQWRCVARLLWRFKTTLPFVALSSVLSMVLGAFSAMRYHYQASVINLAKEAVTSSSGPARAKHGMQEREAIGAMVVSEMILQLAEFARGRLTLRGKTKVVQELKVALFGALLRQDLEYLEQCDLWQLRSLIGSCGTTISQVVDFPATLLEAAVRLFTAVLALGRQNGRLAAFLGVMLPARFLLSQALQHCEERLEQSALPDFKGQINSCWSCLVQPASLRTMRAFAREPHELKTFTRFLQVHEELQQRKILIFRLMQPLQALLEHALEIGTLWYGGRLALRGDMDFGELSSAVLVATGAFDGARFAQAAAANVSRQALGPLAQMAQLLARRPRIGRWDLDWSGAETDQVTFSYQQRGVEVLKGLSFQVREGEFLGPLVGGSQWFWGWSPEQAKQSHCQDGILGTTGSGKSTVLSLMLRLYEPTSGRILLDGREIKDYNPLWLRYHIGFVSQDLVLCNRTVRENLLYGVAEAAEVVGDAAAKEALRVAQCEETFFNTEAFPNLWHTDVGVGGSDLSGGEKQRLAVARAIVKKPKLLILDEATSALDEISQARLQDEIEKLRKEDGHDSDLCGSSALEPRAGRSPAGLAGGSLG